MNERWFLPFPIDTIDLCGKPAVLTSLDAAEVERRACLGASALIAEEVEGTFVASSVSAGWQNPVVCLSIWLSGAAVAPIDLDDGKSRVESMLSALNARVLVVNEEQDSRSLSSNKILTTLDLFSSRQQQQSRVPAEWPSAGSSRNKPSHCFFTSGTTGVPKGCVSTFFALAAYAEARNSKDGVEAASRIVCCSAHTFDPSLGDLAQAALSGATLCVSAHRVRETTLGDLVRAARGTHVTSTPALWATVEGELSHINLSLGGERMPDSMSARCVYGVTECCVYQTSCGEPLAGTKIKIVDGQILIGGDCLVGARYLDGDLPFSLIDGERYYQSGDEGAFVDGKLEVYGRLDDQVKVDGVRVELGDVEATLLSQCRGLVVECRAAKLPDRGKIVCVVKTASSCENKDGDDELARRAMHVKLSHFWDAPRRLKPVRIEFLKGREWPTTANGKTDRRALLSLFDKENRPPQAQHEPLRTPTEVAVSRCWRELLIENDQRPASASDDFVAMGGDSLAALRAARRLEAWASGLSATSRGEGGKFGDERVFRFPPEKMFELRTVRRYAAFVEDSAAFDERFAVKQTREEYEETVEDVAGDAAAAFRPDVIACLLNCLGSGNISRRRRTMSPLARAAQVGSVDCLKLLLTKFATTVTDSQRRTPLAIAAAGGFSECCALLLEAGAPLAARDSKKQSPLHHCARTGDAATMRALLEEREGRHPEKLVNARDRWGRPPLSWVALRSDDDPDESLEVAKVLCDAGADPRLPILKESAQHRHTSLVAETPFDICLRRRSDSDTAGRLADLFAQYENGGATPPEY